MRMIDEWKQFDCFSRRRRRRRASCAWSGREQETTSWWSRPLGAPARCQPQPLAAFAPAAPKPTAAGHPATLQVTGPQIRSDFASDVSWEARASFGHSVQWQFLAFGSLFVMLVNFGLSVLSCSFTVFLFHAI